jgi:hypothetical protein
MLERLRAVLRGARWVESEEHLDARRRAADQYRRLEELAARRRALEVRVEAVRRGD